MESRWRRYAREKVESSWYGPRTVGGAHGLVQAEGGMGQARQRTASWASSALANPDRHECALRQCGRPGLPGYHGSLWTMKDIVAHEATCGDFGRNFFTLTHMEEEIFFHINLVPEIMLTVMIIL